MALGLVGVFAVTTIAVLPADAKHYRANVSTHEHEHSSSSSPPYSAIVVDANSGAVLQSSNADELRHPASLTKIMTLYLLFERLEAGKIKLDTQMPVSEHASVQAPTKLGLKPGHTIAVEDAIKGLVTKSANDAAVVVAETLGGSESDFAEMMTRKAHALGMTHTIYRNASGLPNDEQVTTAREQALLGRAIQERFPRYYRYFSTSSFTYHGETMGNHNHLLGRVEGVDGIKTGYTQASGFNLVTSIHRGNHFIVAVVLGGSSAGSRDAKMRSLIEEHIARASTQHTAPLIAEGNVATPVMRTAEAKTDTKIRGAESFAAKPQTAEAKTDVKVRSYEVASVPQQHWPASKFAEAAAEAQSAPAPAPAKAAPAAARLASVAADDTIRPIPVKTIKVKLAQTQTGALAAVPSGATVDAAVPFRGTPGKPPVAAADTSATAAAAPAAAAAPEPPAATTDATPAEETAVIAPASAPEPPVATPAKAPHKAPAAKTGGMMLAEAQPAVLIAAAPPLAAPAAALTPSPAPVASVPVSETSIVAALTTRPAPAAAKSPAPASVAATPVTAAPAATTVIAAAAPAAAAPAAAPVPPTPVAAAPAAMTIIATAAPAAAPVAEPTSTKSTVVAGLTQTAPAETPAEPAAAAPVSEPAFPAIQAYKPTPKLKAAVASVVEASAPEAKPGRVMRAGWVIQVGAFDAENDAQQRLSKAQAKIGHVLDRADPFTETVMKGEKTLYRARFAGFQQKDEAEAVCKQLKRNDIDCMTIKN